MITLRQEELLQRLKSVRMASPKSRAEFYKEIGVSLTTMHNFLNKTRKTSDLSLDKIELYLEAKEKELGL